MISSDFPYESRYVDVLGSKMHYVEEGEGDPILFLHGNPTSSYLWRNVIPYAIPHGRAIAVDLIGMGRSDKPDLDYRFFDHARYLDEFIETLGLQNVTLVVHDWGSALGFHYAARNPDNVKRIAFMEAIVEPSRWADTNPVVRIMFKRMRNPVKGHRMNGDKAFFLKRMLPNMVVRSLSTEERRAYMDPYPDVKSRKPVEQWPREIPFDGDPADVHDAVSSYNAWLRESGIPKLLIWVKPGVIIRGEQDAERHAAAFPRTETVFVGKGRHYIQEDHPAAIGEALDAWLNRTA